MKPTAEQIARVAEIKEGLAEKTWLFLRPGCHWSFHDMSWKKLKAGPGVDKLHIESCYKFADSLLRTVFRDVPVGGELLQTGRAPEDTAYKAQHDADSVTIGDVLK